MALGELDWIKQLLVCPRCRSALVAKPGGFNCSAPACPYHAAMPFPMAGPWPVLVDFERSVVDREEVVAAADRAKAGGPKPPGLAQRLPTPLRRIWKPPNRVAARNIDLLLRSLLGPTPRLLVVGGATVGNGVSAIYRDPRVQVIGFDIVGSPVTQFIADAHQIPLPTGSVDAVLAQAVLEHVLDPALVVAETHRVLKDGGLVYAETPFLQQVHAGAHDFTRYTASGHRYLFRRFEELAAGSVAGPGTQLLWSVDHVVRGLTRSALAGRAVRGLLFWLRALDRLVPPSYAADDASAFYFLGRKRDREMSAQEIIDYYRGAQVPA
ncbi:class I SAM-dependent methyltransferase [Streptomyces neyagawaensis]|uniref:class I SAM-dependent methyltransferase n=1 Tax=Streptomyces neyagawaensis TaxID=42238 RepID=UPI0006E2A645|nr:class I SAM-dependent methyltransferase [Streptomyces neyagawaensis]MCL6738332.1 methyltransferase domain-containing protein [Streptomyces neyagawaensis]MDE1688159.1 methyltransferase domain-containing protein [Streptomyces neyagawaensis]